MEWFQFQMTLFHLVNIALLLISLPKTTYARCHRQQVRHSVTFNGCEPVLLDTYQCVGNCEGTYAQPSPTDLMTISRNCECCMPSGYHEVPISCGNQQRRIRQITGCRCRPCSVVTGVPDSVVVRPRGRRANPTGARATTRRTRKKNTPRNQGRRDD